MACPRDERAFIFIAPSTRFPLPRASAPIAASADDGDVLRYRSHICTACAPCCAAGCFCSSETSASSSSCKASFGDDCASQWPKTEIDDG